ncbi:hypothetical protein BFF78_37060 [Streptomyces fodineus]|uniref:Uncharacterized protein n=1 Tax=Streptomyces fodineus TaxID=1904616 RepID=A0A1D7YKP6_9ACTN|nr:hypothetical protein [Streptomyces fodineus]AOR35929.1 hypothetical protein BFF78_37060 [Streptomyces fodineus]
MTGAAREAAERADPALFDGDGTDGLLLSCARTSQRHHALRPVPSTAVPSRRQLPGGTSEPPEEQDESDLHALRAHPARELPEEIGPHPRPTPYPMADHRHGSCTTGTRSW